MVAVYLGGGWDFVTPVEGWRAWIADEWLEGVWSGGAWVAGALSLSPSGSAFAVRSLEVDHVVSAGASSTTGTMIPSHSLVFGVAGRVLSDLGGAATSWQLGVAPASPDRYGSGLGTTTGSWVKGLTSSPLAYYADTALTLTAVGGDFGGGSVRLVVHYAELTLPSA